MTLPLESFQQKDQKGKFQETPPYLWLNFSHWMVVSCPKKVLSAFTEQPRLDLVGVYSSFIVAQLVYTAFFVTSLFYIGIKP